MRDGELERALGPLDATAVVVGAMVGVGIFFTPSKIAALAGSSALWVWALGGLIALIGAACFAEMGRLEATTGGQYQILRRAWGRGVGFVYVVCNATAIQAGAIAIIAAICVLNAAQALALELSDPRFPALFLIAGVAALNAGALRWGAALSNWTGLGKVLALLAIAIAAVALGEGESGLVEGPPKPTAMSPAPTTFLAALVPALFTFGGWQQALWIGGEIKDGQRNVPLGILSGVVVVVLAYLAVNWAYLHLLGVEGVAASQTLAGDAVEKVLGPVASRVVAAAVAVSALGVLNAQLLTGPRLVVALAQDGFLPALLGRVHPERRTPVMAIAAMAGIAGGLLLAAGMGGVDRLLTGVVLVDAVFFAATAAALLRLPARTRSRVFAVLFVLCEIGVIIGAGSDPATAGAAWIGGAWILGASLAYLWARRRANA